MEHPVPQSPAEIRARLNEIESELFAEDSYTRSHITAPNCDDLNREREQHLAVLSRERVELLSKLPSTGMASGQRLVIAKVLGDIRNWPEPEPIDDGYDPTDPYARYEREMGIFRDE